MKTLLIPLGVILFFRRQVISWSNPLFCVIYFSGQEVDSMVYTMTVALGDSYWHRYYLWNSQRNPLKKENNQTCQGLLPRRNDEALPEVLAETAPERVARTGRTAWIETILPLGVVLQYYIIPSSVTLPHIGDYLTKGHIYALEILSTYESILGRESSFLTSATPKFRSQNSLQRRKTGISSGHLFLY